MIDKILEEDIIKLIETNALAGEQLRRIVLERQNLELQAELTKYKMESAPPKLEP